MTRLTRLTALDDLVFPIEERAIYTEGAGSRLVKVPDRRAIVNARNDRIVGVVGRDYRVVTHREALDWGLACCRVAFPGTRAGEWEIRGIDAPASGGHCFVDLVHCSGALDFSLVPGSERPEAYGPFVRVTNSYNGLRALSFEIGMQRKVCRNGLILPEALVQIRYSHRRRDLPVAIDFDVHHERLAQARSEFSSLILRLQQVPVAAHDVVRLVVDALEFREPDEEDGTEAQWDDWRRLELRIRVLGRLYAQEMGDNAYALFNVITDLATRPPEIPRFRRERHTLQRLAGRWLAGFNGSPGTPARKAEPAPEPELEMA